MYDPFRYILEKNIFCRQILHSFPRFTFQQYPGISWICIFYYILLPNLFYVRFLEDISCIITASSNLIKFSNTKSYKWYYNEKFLERIRVARGLSCDSTQPCILNPVKHLGWSFFAKTVDIWKFNISLYSVQMRENTDQKNSEYGHFPHNAEGIKRWHWPEMG